MPSASLCPDCPPGDRVACGGPYAGRRAAPCQGRADTRCIRWGVPTAGGRVFFAPAADSQTAPPPACTTMG